MKQYVFCYYCLGRKLIGSKKKREWIKRKEKCVFFSFQIVSHTHFSSRIIFIVYFFSTYCHSPSSQWFSRWKWDKKETTISICILYCAELKHICQMRSVDVVKISDRICFISHYKTVYCQHSKQQEHKVEMNNMWNISRKLWPGEEPIQRRDKMVRKSRENMNKIYLYFYVSDGVSRFGSINEWNIQHSGHQMSAPNNFGCPLSDVCPNDFLTYCIAWNIIIL